MMLSPRRTALALLGAVSATAWNWSLKTLGKASCICLRMLSDIRHPLPILRRVTWGAKFAMDTFTSTLAARRALTSRRYLVELKPWIPPMIIRLSSVSFSPAGVSTPAAGWEEPSERTKEFRMFSTRRTSAALFTRTLPRVTCRNPAGILTPAIPAISAAGRQLSRSSKSPDGPLGESPRSSFRCSQGGSPLARGGQSSLTFDTKGRVHGVAGRPPAQSRKGNELVRWRLRRNRPREELLRRLNGPAIGDLGCIFS